MNEKRNQEFRAWTRGTSFSINMGKTQVVTLVAIGVSREKFLGLTHPMLRLYVPAIRGLQERGLVRRPKSWGPESWKKERNPLVRIMEPTEAGEHILALLRIAGVYQELRAELLSYTADEHGFYARATA